MLRRLWIQLKFSLVVKGWKYIQKTQLQWYLLRLGAVGKNVTIMNGCIFPHPGSVFIGNHVFINFHSVLFSAPNAGITIADNVVIGPRCMFVTGGHAIDEPNVPIIDNPATAAPIVIEENVWIGANVTILPGVRIAKGCVVGAGSVVTKDTKPFTVVAGVPARLIRSRLPLSKSQKIK